MPFRPTREVQFLDYSPTAALVSVPTTRDAARRQPAFTNVLCNFEEGRIAAIEAVYQTEKETT